MHSHAACTQKHKQELINGDGLGKDIGFLKGIIIYIMQRVSGSSPFGLKWPCLPSVYAPHGQSSEPDRPFNL